MNIAWCSVACSLCSRQWYTLHRATEVEGMIWGWASQFPLAGRWLVPWIEGHKSFTETKVEAFLWNITKNFCLQPTLPVLCTCSQTVNLVSWLLCKDFQVLSSWKLSDSANISKDLNRDLKTSIEEEDAATTAGHGCSKREKWSAS